jgi:hypothetical protein
MDERCCRASAFDSQAALSPGRSRVKVETEADLSTLRHAVGRLDHDDERLTPDHAVTLHRAGALVGTISCADDALAWTAYRICAGLRFKRESAAAWAASELAGTDDPLALAA